MLKELLEEKDYLPILKMNDGSPVTRENWGARRQEMLELLYEYSYGRSPEKAEFITGEISSAKYNEYAGKVIEENVNIRFRTSYGFGYVPFTLYTPKRFKNPPVLLHIAFRPAPDKYIPVEEITDRGYALAVVCYESIINDKHFGDFSGGLGRHFDMTIEREPNEWGKIGMWAYGASIVLDYLLTRDDLDGEHVSVMGHSRLGKTALWAGALDERFFTVISNDSGYGGAASSKKGKGERVRDFIRGGSWDWYCERFKDYVDEKEDEKPYDQSFLLALVAPRYLVVGSATEDRGADPEAEFLTTLHASAAWELLGKPGLICPDEMPEPDKAFHDGSVGYHLRTGKHFLSREDWNYYMDFIDKKIGRK